MSAGTRGLQYDWQNECKSRGERAKYILANGLFTDCEFLVGSDEGKEIIKAHKVFLVMGSPVFEAMLYGGMAATENGKPVEVLDVQPGIFKDLLEFIYSEQITFDSFDQACELWYAAKKYMVPGLVELCSQYMLKDLSPDTACRALEFAILYEDSNLKEKSLDVIRCRSKQALESQAFEEITESTLLMLVKDDELSITSEMELFDAVRRWGLKECERKEIESINSNLREVLTNVLPHIRFLTMKSEEFVDGPAVSGILQQDETLAILMNLVHPGKCTMPTNISSSRDIRNVYYPPSFKTTASVGSSTTRSLPESMDHGQNRLYCFRRVSGESYILNMGILDCAVSLTVDRNVCIQGIVIASQVPRNDEESDSSTYIELLYCHLLDRDGTRLTYAHFSGRATKSSTLDVLFNRAVYVQRNREYRICVVLNRGGYYPLSIAAIGAAAHGVQFRFGDSGTDAAESNSVGIRDGFIRGVIFNL